MPARSQAPLRLQDDTPMGFDLLRLTLDELWVIHDYVRQHDKLGKEWNKDFNTRVMAGILDGQQSPSRQSALVCWEDELWQMDRQIPGFLMVGVQPVGRDLLTKVMQLLVKLKRAAATSRPDMTVSS